MSDEITIEVATEDSSDSTEEVKEEVKEATDSKVENDQSFMLGQLVAKVDELSNKVDSAVTMGAVANERLDVMENRETIDAVVENANDRVEEAEEKAEELADAVEQAASDGVISDDEVEYIEDVAEDVTDDEEPNIKKHWMLRTWGKG